MKADSTGLQLGSRSSLAQNSEVGVCDPFMEGVSLPLHARLRTAAVPKLIHKQMMCPGLRGGSSNQEEQYVCV